MYLVIESIPYEEWHEIIETLEELNEEIKYCKKNNLVFEIYEIKKEIKNV